MTLEPKRKLILAYGKPDPLTDDQGEVEGGAIGETESNLLAPWDGTT